MGEPEPAVRGGVPPQSNALERANGLQKHNLTFKREQERRSRHLPPAPATHCHPPRAPATHHLHLPPTATHQQPHYHLEPSCAGDPAPADFLQEPLRDVHGRPQLQRKDAARLLDLERRPPCAALRAPRVPRAALCTLRARLAPLHRPLHLPRRPPRPTPNCTLMPSCPRAQGSTTRCSQPSSSVKCKTSCRTRLASRSSPSTPPSGSAPAPSCSSDVRIGELRQDSARGDLPAIYDQDGAAAPLGPLRSLGPSGPRVPLPPPTQCPNVCRPCAAQRP